MTVQTLKEVINRNQFVNIVEYQTGRFLYSGVICLMPDDAFVRGTKVIDIMASGTCLVITISCA